MCGGPSSLRAPRRPCEGHPASPSVPALWLCACSGLLQAARPALLSLLLTPTSALRSVFSEIAGLRCLISHGFPGGDSYFRLSLLILSDRSLSKLLLPYFMDIISSQTSLRMLIGVFLEYFSLNLLCFLWLFFFFSWCICLHLSPPSCWLSLGTWQSLAVHSRDKSTGEGAGVPSSVAGQQDWLFCSPSLGAYF